MVVVGAPGVALVSVPRMLRESDEVRASAGCGLRRSDLPGRRTRNACLTASRFSTSALKTGFGKSKGPDAFVAEALSCGVTSAFLVERNWKGWAAAISRSRPCPASAPREAHAVSLEDGAAEGER